MNDIKPRRAPRLPWSVAGIACIFALATLFLSFTLCAEAGELQWRRARSTASKSSQQAVKERFIAQPAKSSRIDLAVRKAAFEDEGGPQFAPGAQGSESSRSVIVERRQGNDSYRSAQFSGSSSTPGSTSAPGSTSGPGSTSQPGTGSPPGASGSDPLDQDLRSPFIDSPAELPPLEEPQTDQLETPPLPDDSQTQPGRMDRQPGDPSSTEFQPRVQPRDQIAPPLPEGVPPVSEDVLSEEREKSKAACEQGFTDLRDKTIGKLNLGIAVTGDEGADYPYECTLEDAWHEGRCWEQTTYLWKASALCHKPLYFEQEQLERYGHSWSPCFAPFCAGAHFFTRLPVLPYCMGVEPPCECVYALGHYRPGNCAPYMCNPIPISGRGALFQAGAAVGTAAFLP